jgi:hypothetical protein
VSGLLAAGTRRVGAMRSRSMGRVSQIGGLGGLSVSVSVMCHVSWFPWLGSSTNLQAAEPPIVRRQ